MRVTTSGGHCPPGWGHGKSVGRAGLVRRALLLLSLVSVGLSGRLTAATPDYFELSLQELARVDVVTASLSPQPLSELPASLSVITRKQIRESGARNLYDLLRLIPGVRVDLGNRGRPVISIRGVQTDSSNHLLFLLDGHVLNEPGNGSAAFLYDLSRLPLHNVQRIEVLRGPGSPVFGANAFLGAVNVITRSPEQMGAPELTVRGEFDANGEVGEEVNLLAGGRLSEDWSASINLNLVNRPGETIAVAADAAGRSGEVDNEFGQFDAQLRIESRHTRFTGRFTRQEQGDHYGTFYQLAPDDEMLFSGGFLELLDSRGLNEAMDLKTRLYGDWYHGKARVSLIPRGSQSLGSPWYGFNDTGAYAVLFQDLAKYGLDLRIGFHGLTNHRMTAGLQLEYQSQGNTRTLRNFIGTSGPFDPLVDVSGSENFSRDADRLVSALFIEDLWKVTTDLNVILGLRLDHYSNAGVSLNPRVGFNWHLAPSYQLRALLGTSFREPDFRSLYLDAGSFFGNPDLEEERIRTFEIGSSIHFSPALSMDITLYHNQLTDLIVVSPDTARFENIGNLSTRGIELDIVYEYGSGASLAAGYSFVDVYDGNRAGLMAPRHSGSVALSGPLPGGFEGGVQLYWQSRSDGVGDDARDPLDAYLLLNARLGYRWSRQLSLEAAVYNILDRDYFYPAPEGSYPGGLPAAGRSALLGLKLEL